MVHHYVMGDESHENTYENANKLNMLKKAMLFQSLYTALYASS
jgi:hypothetical protein